MKKTQLLQGIRPNISRKENKITLKINFLQTSLFILIISNFSNVVQYLSQLVLGRYLSVADFGIYNSIQSLSLSVVAFLAIIPFIVTKFMINFQDETNYRDLLISKLFGYLVIINIFFCVLLFLLSHQIGVFLKIYDHTPIYIFIISIFLTVIYTYFDSMLKGLKLYIVSSIQGALLSVFRFSFILLFVLYMHKSYNGALFANVIATIIIILLIYIINVKDILHINNNYEFKKINSVVYINMLKYSIPVCITWIILVFITFSDVIFVKHYFDDYHTGIYSSASVIAKIGFFLSSVLMSVFFPELINNEKIEKSSIPLLTFMLGITLLICGSYVLVVFYFKEFLITLLFGKKYLLAGEYLTRITIFMSIVGVITVIFNFFLAKEIYSYLYVSTIVMILGAISFFLVKMNSPNDVLNIFLYLSAFLLLATLVHTFYRYRENLSGWFLKRQYH